jgi:hypothetical protein
VLCGSVWWGAAIYGNIWRGKRFAMHWRDGCRVDVGFDEIDRLEKKKKYFASCTTYLVDSEF